MSGVSKIVAERNQRVLLDLVAQAGNNVCADCKNNSPRWASHNIGIFICVRCASVHRKIGTHVTKVKSLTLDSWSKEQVENMKAIGNVKANQYWNPDEVRHPPPTNMEESERDSELEKYIRSKYEYGRYRPLSARAAEQLGPSRSRGSLPARSRTAPIRSEISSVPGPSRSPQPPLPSALPQPSSHSPPSAFAPSMQVRSTSSSFPRSSQATSIPMQSQSRHFTPSMRSSSINTTTQVPVVSPNQQDSLTSSTFNDLISIQSPATNSSLTLQYQMPSAPLPGQTSSFTSQSRAYPSSLSTPNGCANPYVGGLSAANITGAFPSSLSRSSDFRSTGLPIFGQDTSPTGMMPTGINSFQQPISTDMSSLATPTTSPPNPFIQLYAGMPTSMSRQPQSLTPGPFSPQSLQPGTFGESSALPFRQNPLPFAPEPGVYPQQQAAQPMQMNGSSNSSSPYAQQAQQAQQLFQSMAGGSNPFGSQWNGT